MIDAYLLSTARDYLETIAAIGSGHYTLAEQYQLDSQRQWLHNELIRLTGLDPADDMAAYCRRLLHVARGSGQ